MAKLLLVDDEAELTARVRAILRRTQRMLPQPARQTLVLAGALVMRPEQRRAGWQGEPLTLKPAEYNLLEVLASAMGQIVPKDQLSRRALGHAIGPDDRSIDVHLCAIRHNLGSLPLWQHRRPRHGLPAGTGLALMRRGPGGLFWEVFAP